MATKRRFKAGDKVRWGRRPMCFVVDSQFGMSTASAIHGPSYLVDFDPAGSLNAAGGFIAWEADLEPWKEGTP